MTGLCGDHPLFCEVHVPRTLNSHCGTRGKTNYRKIYSNVHDIEVFFAASLSQVTMLLPD